MSRIGAALTVAAASLGVCMSSCSGAEDFVEQLVNLVVAGEVTLDGETRKTVGLVHEWESEHCCRFTFTTGSSPSDVIVVYLNRLHLNGTPVNLLRADNPLKSGWSWRIEGRRGETKLFTGSNQWGSPLLFESGTLRFGFDPTNGEMDFAINDAAITTASGNGGDGRRHTLSVKWKGRLPGFVLKP